MLLNSLLIILIVLSWNIMPAISAGIIVSSGSRHRQEQRAKIQITNCILALSDKGDDNSTVNMKSDLCKRLVTHTQCPDVSSDLSDLSNIPNIDMTFFHFYRERFITGCGYFYPHLKSPPDYRSMRDWSEYFSDVWAYIT